MSHVSSNMLMTVPFRGELPVNKDCFLALLSKAPDPDGANFIEIGYKEYTRQPIRWATDQAAKLSTYNFEVIEFARPAQPWVCAHAAVMDSDGVVLAYAVISPALGSYRDQIIFRPGCLVLRSSHSWARLVQV